MTILFALLLWHVVTGAMIEFCSKPKVEQLCKNVLQGLYRTNLSIVDHKNDSIECENGHNGAPLTWT